MAGRMKTALGKTGWSFLRINSATVTIKAKSGRAMPLPRRITAPNIFSDTALCLRNPATAPAIIMNDSQLTIKIQAKCLRDEPNTYGKNFNKKHSCSTKAAKQ